MATWYTADEPVVLHGGPFHGEVVHVPEPPLQKISRRASWAGVDGIAYELVATYVITDAGAWSFEAARLLRSRWSAYQQPDAPT